ncbi:MAG: rhodanese-like domain-containing protein [Candidatus Magasanikbacteria bacterium]
MSKKVNPEKLNNWLENREAVVIDVREPDEYSRGHIPSALNLPLSTLKPDVLDNIEAEKVVMQCNTGGRSSRACAVVKENTDKQLYDLDGGIEAWKQAGFEIEKNKDLGLPLQRQVQIAVGLLVITGLVLGYFLHEAFYLLSLFVSLGLLNAGLTGWCGMAKLLSKAFWN